MSHLNWGPLPNFAARLADTMPRRPNGWRRPLGATRAFGGPWGWLLRDNWPSFRPIDPPSAPWITAILDRFRRDPLAGNPFGNDDELTGELFDVHRFLVMRNVRFLAEVLPGPAAIPLAMLQVSATGLAWALWVYELATHGLPNPARISLPANGEDWQGRPTAGDLLSLHLWIEMLVAEDSFPRAPIETVRVLGGLRRKTFLVRYPWFAQSRHPQVQQRGMIVRELLALSPLSQWVYPDLLPPQSDCSAMATVATLGPVADRSPEVMAAREGWQALLARSLVAALLSPTAAWEQREKAENDLVALRGRKGPNLELIERKRIHDRVETLRHETQIQGISRPVRLSETFTKTGAVGTLLALRTLDQLVRHLALATGPLLLRDQAADAENPTLAMLATKPGNRLFRRLKEALFGGAKVKDLGELSDMHRVAVERLVVPALPTRGALVSLAESAGLEVDQVLRLRDHFTRAPIALPHPIREGRANSPTPAVLLAMWCEAMKPPPEPEVDPPQPAAEAEADVVAEIIEPGNE